MDAPLVGVGSSADSADPAPNATPVSAAAPMATPAPIIANLDSRRIDGLSLFIGEAPEVVEDDVERAVASVVELRRRIWRVKCEKWRQDGVRGRCAGRERNVGRALGRRVPREVREVAAAGRGHGGDVVEAG